MNRSLKRNLLGIINLMKIKNWESIKTQDNVTTVAFSKINSLENENTIHYSFPFNINNYRDLEKFTLEFKNVKDIFIDFNVTNKVFPLIPLRVVITKKIKRRI